jgi:tRNA (cmo5U34)-methyltransferase
MSDNNTPFNSSDYDRGIRKTLPYYDLLFPEILSMVKAVKPDVKVWLDTGCGTGALVEKALQIFPHAEFMLADPSGKMLAIARERLGSVPQGKIMYAGEVKSEELTLNGRPKPDVITAVLSHHYCRMENRVVATQRCFDLLSPGGLYITIENIRPDTDTGIFFGLERWKAFQLDQGRDAAAVSEHASRFDSEYFPIRVSQHKELLERVGFAAAELFWFSYMQAGFFAVKNK